jgi:hypothetical protein
MRAGLEHVGERAVAQLLAGEVAAVAGVVAGVVGQGQHLARVGVEHHHAAGLGLVRGHGVAQLLVGEELHLAVDRKLHVLAIDRRHFRAHALDHAAQAVLDDAARAGLAGQVLVEGQLHAFLAVVLHIGEAHHVRGGLALGVLALVLLSLVDALDVQRSDLLAHVPVELALDPHEGLVLVGQLGVERGQRHLQQARQLLELGLHLGLVVLHVLGNGPDTGGGHAGG